MKWVTGPYRSYALCSAALDMSKISTAKFEYSTADQTAQITANGHVVAEDANMKFVCPTSGYLSILQVWCYGRVSIVCEIQLWGGRETTSS